MLNFTVFLIKDIACNCLSALLIWSWSASESSFCQQEARRLHFCNTLVPLPPLVPSLSAHIPSLTHRACGFMFHRNRATVYKRISQWAQMRRTCRAGRFPSVPCVDLQGGATCKVRSERGFVIKDEWIPVSAKAPLTKVIVFVESPCVRDNARGASKW